MEPNQTMPVTADDVIQLPTTARIALLESGILSGQEAQQLLMTFLDYLTKETNDNILMLEVIRDILGYTELVEERYSQRAKQLKEEMVAPLERESKALNAGNAQIRSAIRDQFLITGTKAAAGFLLVEATKPTYILPEPGSSEYLALCRVLNERAPQLLQVRIKSEDLKKYLQQEGDQWIAEYGVEAELKAHIRLT